MLPAALGCHRPGNELSVAHLALDNGLPRSVQAEVDVPLLGPGRQQAELFMIGVKTQFVAAKLAVQRGRRRRVGLQQHLLDPHHPAAAPVHVGRPVDILRPEGRKAVGSVAQLADCLLVCLRRQGQPRIMARSVRFIIVRSTKVCGKKWSREKVIEPLIPV